MIRAGVSRILVTLAMAAVAALALWAVGGPAPFLIGPVVAATLLGLAGRAESPPSLWRNLAFALTGFAMGAGVDQQAAADALRWPLSLLLLLACLVAIMGTGAFLLRALRGLDHDAAMLSSTPGALSYVLAVAESRGADVGAVSLLQSIRLILLVVGLPLILGGAADAPGAHMPWPAALAGSVGAAALGWWTERRGLPGGFFLGALFVGVAAALSGAVAGRPPLWLTAPAFIVIGSAIGCRFCAVRWPELKRAASAGALVVSVAAGLSAVFALAASSFLDQPFGAVWIAYAPGGVEAMGAIALALGYDPGFVAAHHVARLFLLAGLLPLLLKRR